MCRECYRWAKWGGKCSYYWINKKECGSLVKDQEEMLLLEQIRRR